MLTTLYEQRQPLALVPSLLTLAVLLLLSTRLPTHPKKEVPEPDLAVSLITLENPVVSAPQPVPVPPTPRPVTPKTEARPQTQPTPDRTPSPVSTPVAPVAASTPVTAPPAPPTPAHVAPAAGIEASYIAKLRAYLQANKRYPTSREARLQRPTGEVEVWFVLNRNGQLVEVGIEHSSNSLILDGAALSTVRGGQYPQFPEEAWEGKPTHRFTVKLDYQV